MNIQLINQDIAFLINNSRENITLFLLDVEKIISISKDIFVEEELLIESNIEKENTIISVIKHNGIFYYLHIKNSNVFITPYLNGYSDKSIDLKIDILFEQYQIRKTKYSYEIIDPSNNSFEINYNIFEVGSSTIGNFKRSREDEPYEYIKIQYSNCISFIEYNIKANAILLRTLFVSVMFSDDIDIGFSPLSYNNFMLKNLSKTIIKRSTLHKKKVVVIDINNNIHPFNTILITVNNIFYIVEYFKKGKIKIIYDNKVNLLLDRCELETRCTSQGVYFKGILSHKFNNISANTIVNRYGMKLAELDWIDSNHVKFMIPYTKIIELNDVHNTLFVGKEAKVLYPLHCQNSNDITNKFLSDKNYKEFSFISRINLKGNYTITIIPKSPIYSLSHKIKINLAHYLSPYFKKIINKTINLYFEKDASSANESGFITFEEVKKLKDTNSINKYILDGKSVEYKKIKNKYGKDLIKRYSFRHYLYIFLASNFISSELSNHVLSVRIFHHTLLNKIRQTPLYFLQHGIMFAKPVDNPMAKSFHKENQANNVIKSVISSDLEANEFYKMGYTDDDLMKTGLPKLDRARLNHNANKIAFMPTWRYWEEGMIVKGEIENTTYYKTLMDFINTFEEAGLLDRLLLVPHNKFAEYIKEKFYEYSNVISTEPSEALKQSIIFITDYSSIIYDAIYRGAYPIFYWKEKDYLIENYKAVPPVHEKNAPGIIVKSNEELINSINEAIKNNYKIPEYIVTRYSKINEFNDNRNTERVILELKKLHVL